MNKLAKKIILSVISMSAVLGTSALAADLSGWAVSDYQQANEAGLVSYSVEMRQMKPAAQRRCNLCWQSGAKRSPFCRRSPLALLLITERATP